MMIAVSLSENANAGKAQQKLVVVELFTSQGCSSCPPADDLLAELGKGENILALSYSVDYWNFLGWEDTFSQPDCTLRQKKYNNALGKNGVYTPQMIIQGAGDLVGSRRDLANRMISAARKKTAHYPAPEITFETDGDMINLNIAAIKDKPKGTIWVIGYNKMESVDILRGEQAGHRRSYHNVVHAIKRIGSWMGQEVKLTLSKADIGRKAYDAYALLLQDGEVGPIIAAAKLSR